MHVPFNKNKAVKVLKLESSYSQEFKRLCFVYFYFHCPEWAADQSQPDDDWLYEMKYDLYKQAEFLESHNIVAPAICKSYHEVCSLYQITGRDLDRSRFPLRWQCTNHACNSPNNYNFLYNSCAKL